MEIGERVLKLMNNKGLTAYSLSNDTGISQATIGRLIKNNSKPNAVNLKILSEYFNVSTSWLLTGNNVDSEISAKEDAIADKNEIEVIQTKSKLFKLIPFYNINVSAGNVDFLDGGILAGQEPDDYLQIPANVDADISFPTFGHSMYPEISNGDRVAYKIINDWTFFNYGMKYLIITREQRMVKYIKKHEKEGFLLLESRNKDYEPIDIPITSITNILQVRYICKTEM